MLRVIFGNPGAGKTTFVTRECVKILKNKKTRIKHIYTNYESKVSNCVSMKGLGTWTFPYASYIGTDEAGIEYNNRKFKSLPHETIEWAKKYRHYIGDVGRWDFVSQSWEDIDVTFRRLADQYWHLRKIGPFTMARRIYKFVDIDEETHQIVDGYKWGSFLLWILPYPFHQDNFKIFLRRPYYQYFDSYSKSDLPLGEVTHSMDPVVALKFKDRKKYRVYIKNKRLIEKQIK